MSVCRGIVEGPKFAGFPTLLRNYAFVYKVELTLDVDQGIWYETCRFEVSGDDKKVREFIQSVNSSIGNYNNEINK